jgi:hypothetical protein
VSADPNPYEAPSGEAAQRPELSLEYSQTTLVSILTGLLAVQALLGAVTAAGCVALNVATLTLETEEQVVSLTNKLAVAGVWLYYTTFIPFGMFLVRANKNARKISDAPMAFTPGSMVWWFAVPVFSLFKPYQAVREVWTQSTPLFDDGQVPVTSNLLGLWWGAWLASTVVSRITSLTLRSAEPATHNAIAAFDNILAVALCALAIQLVRGLDGRQRASVSR